MEVTTKDGKIDPANADRVMEAKAGLKSGSGANKPYWEEKLKHERIKRQLAELELNNRLSKVVRVEWIKRDLGKMFGFFRERTLEIPEKGCSLIRGEKSVGKIQEALEDMSNFDPEKDMVS